LLEEMGEDLRGRLMEELVLRVRRRRIQRLGDRVGLGVLSDLLGRSPVRAAGVERIENDVAALFIVEPLDILAGRIVDDGGMTAVPDLRKDLGDEGRFAELGAVVDLWNNQRKEWWPKQEEEVSGYIARFLRRDLVERGVVINREVQIRRGRAGEMPGQDTDIYVDAPILEESGGPHYGGVSVVIEVKGTWNNGVMTDMEEQLRDRYLRNSGCRTGLYLAVHFTATSWRSTDNRRAKSERWNIDELRERLVQQATALSGSVRIGSLVLDASLDSTVVTGMEV